MMSTVEWLRWKCTNSSLHVFDKQKKVLLKLNYNPWYPFWAQHVLKGVGQEVDVVLSLILLCLQHNDFYKNHTQLLHVLCPFTLISCSGNLLYIHIVVITGMSKEKRMGIDIKWGAETNDMELVVWDLGHYFSAPALLKLLGRGGIASNPSRQAQGLLCGQHALEVLWWAVLDDYTCINT